LLQTGGWSLTALPHHEVFFLGEARSVDIEAGPFVWINVGSGLSLIAQSFSAYFLCNVQVLFAPPFELDGLFSKYSFSPSQHHESFTLTMFTQCN
jgi:hypothetical protein